MTIPMVSITVPVARLARRPGIAVVAVLLVLLAACSPAQEDGTTSAVSAPEGIRFSDVAAEVGLDFQHGAFRWGLSADPMAMMSGGLCWLDYDRDGWMDLYVVNTYSQDEAGQWEAEGGFPTNVLYHNEEGRFTDVSVQAQADLADRGNGCIATDLNRDGWTDIYITTERVNALLWNNGDGTFTEGAAAAGVDAYGWQTAAAAGDLNGDGWPDLFVAGYVDMNNRIPDATQGFPNTHLGRRDLFFVSQGATEGSYPTFREVGVGAGLEADNFEYGLGALLTDLDADGDLDLFVANDTNPNRLYLNVPWEGGIEADPQGIGFRFEEIGAQAGVADTNSGMGVAGADYNNDGRNDIVITNLGDQYHSFYVNQTMGERIFFREAHDFTGLTALGVGWTGWGTAWSDFDLDGDLDLMITHGKVPVQDPAADAQHVQLYSNLAMQGQNGRFEDVSESAGLNQLGPYVGRGSAVADFDNDGDLDVALSTIGGPLALLRNDGAGGNWLALDLQDGLPGTAITAILPDGQRIRRETHAGNSYLSSEDPRCNLGLGEAERVKELRVRWPNGEETRLTNVRANQVVTVSQSDGPWLSELLGSDD